MPDAIFLRQYPTPATHQPSKETQQPNLDRVLVVAASAINRIVVSRIVERLGLKVTGQTPAEAARVLAACAPGTVILDGWTEEDGRERFLREFSAYRKARETALPLLIGLASSASDERNARNRTLLDALVVKPITSEALQPVLIQLIEAARGTHRLSSKLPFASSGQL